MKRPLLAPLVGLMIGIFLTSLFSPPFYGMAVLALGGILLLILSFFFRTPKGIALSSLFLFVALGALIASLSLQKIRGESDLLSGTEGEKVYWVGRVASDCEPEEEGGKMEVEVLGSRTGTVIQSRRGKLLLRLGKGLCPFQEGDVIQTYSSFRRPERFKNQGAFDYPFYLLTRGITATSFVESNEFAVKIGEEKGRLLHFFQRLKFKAQEGLQSIPQEEPRRILSALLLGEKKELTPEIEDLFRRTGTTHILVVSGLHLVMVGGLFYFLFRFLLSLSPPLLLRISVRKWAFLLSLFPITAYAALVGFSPSVLRSILTVILLGALLLFSRERDGLSLLLLVAFSLLILQPLLFFDLSFQLSFLSVASLILLLPPWDRYFKKRWEKYYSHPWLRRPFEILLASVAVQVGLLPLLIHRFHQFGVFSLPANLVLVPAFSLGVMPLGFLGILASWIAPAAAGSLFSLTTHVLNPFLSFLRFLATRPLSYPYWTGFDSLQIILYYTLLFFCLSPQTLRFKRTGIAFLLAFNFLAWMTPPLVNRLDTSLRLTFLDVGQGDALLLELPHGKKILVDGGGMAASNFDVGEKVLLPYFFSKNFWRIDTVVLTHPHPDHFGGLKKVIEAFPPKELWWNGESVDSPSFQDFMAEVKKDGIPLIKLDAGVPSFEREGVHFEILSPPSGGFSETRPDSATINNHSLVMELSQGDLKILLTGDLQKEGEQDLLKKGKVDRVTILKIPHHGSDTSSTEEWVKTMCPKVGLIGVGRNNFFHFPRPEVLKRYESMGTNIFRTDQDGETQLRWDGKELKVTSFGGRQWVWRLDLPNPSHANPEALCAENSFGSSSGSRP